LRTPPVIAVVLPRLLTRLAGLRSPSAEWLLGRADREGTSGADWRSWLLEWAGAGPADTRGWPAGPCVRASIDGRWPEGTWLCATPVHLLTGIDHLQLAPLETLRIDAEESTELVRSIDSFLAEVGMKLVRVRDATWALRWNGPLRASTWEPAQAAGLDVFDFMPSGPQAAKLRSLMNEIQMLLHDHPVNERRARKGEPVINSLWLWGAGESSGHASQVLPTLHTDDAWLGGIWRMTGSNVQPVEADWSRDGADGQRVIVAASEVPDESLEDTIFRPLQALVAQGKVRSVQFLVGDQVFQVNSAVRWKFWRRTRPLSELLT
jgi:hypothetical protein